MYLNGGGRDGEPGNIGWIPQDQSASGVGGVRNNTVLADIDGDSRADVNNPILQLYSSLLTSTLVFEGFSHKRRGY